MNKIKLLIVLLIPFSVIAQVKVGTKAPEITLEGIYNRESDKIPTIKSLRGKIIILDFWATWCSPCIAAFPVYNELSIKYKNEGVQFIAITDDPKEKLDNFLAKMEMDLWVGHDEDKKGFDNYQVTGRPQMYIINREGIIVYEGNKVNEEMIEEVIATNTVTLSKKKEYAKVITRGGFTPGEDPIYNGLIQMLGREKDYSLIEQVIIRPSLETSFGSYGSYKNDGHVGLTYSGGDLSNIFMFLNRKISSTIWITNNTGDTTKYDIIYWKKTDDYKSAFKEVEKKLTDGLSITFDTVKTLKTVNVLTVHNSNENLKKYEEIEQGTINLYTHINRFIFQLENKSGQYYIVDDSSQNTYIYNNGMNSKQLNMNKGSSTEIIDYLKERGITVIQEKRTIYLFEINPK